MSEQTGIDPIMCPWCGGHSGMYDAYGVPWSYFLFWEAEMYDRRICIRCMRNEIGTQTSIVLSPFYKPPWVELSPLPVVSYPYPAGFPSFDRLPGVFLTDYSFPLEHKHEWLKPQNAWEHVLVNANDD